MDQFCLLRPLMERRANQLVSARFACPLHHVPGTNQTHVGSKRRQRGHDPCPQAALDSPRSRLVQSSSVAPICTLQALLRLFRLHPPGVPSLAGEHLLFRAAPGSVSVSPSTVAVFTPLRVPLAWHLLRG